MKNYIALISFVALMICSMPLIAEAPKTGETRRAARPSGTPSATLLNINRISAWYESNGECERNPATFNSGLTYPRGTSQAIYVSGLVWGGKVIDGKTPVIRAGGSDYNRGAQPGAILGIRTGTYESASDPNVRIWRIRKEYAVADLRQDAAEMLMKALGAVTDADIAAIRAQYKKDWQEWPASKGAPFYDSNNDGLFSPQFDASGNPKLYPLADEPGLASADQVIWFVCHDLASLSQWASPQIGLEQQTTIWGYNRTDAVGDVLLKKFRLIYKGTATTPANATIDSMYITHWSDPDLGIASDDYVGCDTTLSLGYVYNANDVDSSYQKFSLAPPSFGYDFLQGPIVPGSATDTAVFDLKFRKGYKNLPMTSFVYFAAGGVYSDPPHTANGAIQWYNMMRGLPPTPQGPPAPPRLINPVTGLATSFWLSGEPVAKTGWIDGTLDVPGDRRMLQTSGPFTMAVGDTQEIVVGAIGGSGSSRLESISKLKENDKNIQGRYSAIKLHLLAVGDKTAAVLPGNYSLSQNYPNPFNSSTTIRYGLPAPSMVNLEIYDVLGRIVATLVNGVQDARSHEVSWQARVPSGMYFYRIKAVPANDPAKSFVQVKKMLLLK